MASAITATIKVSRGRWQHARYFFASSIRTGMCFYCKREMVARFLETLFVNDEACCYFVDSLFDLPTHSQNLSFLFPLGFPSIAIFSRPAPHPIPPLNSCTLNFVFSGRCLSTLCLSLATGTYEPLQRLSRSPHQRLFLNLLALTTRFVHVGYVPTHLFG